MDTIDIFIIVEILHKCIYSIRSTDVNYLNYKVQIIGVQGYVPYTHIHDDHKVLEALFSSMVQCLGLGLCHVFTSPEKHFYFSIL